MTKTTPNEYLKTKVHTASPAELRLMLFDGALKFCRQAQQALSLRKFEDSFSAVNKAKNIILELDNSLNHDKDPDICGKLSALYVYLFRLLVDTNLERSPEPLQQCISLLEYERETWLMVVSTLKKDQKDQGGQPSEAAILELTDTQALTTHENTAGPLAKIGPRSSATASPPNFSAQG